MMEIQLRRERPEDYRTVEEVTREAFWGMHHPDCDEHLLAHKLRSVAAFVPELDYVAIVDGAIVGNIMFSTGRIVDARGREHTVLNFGPLSVLPAYQQRGVGTALMRRTIAEATRLGYRAIVFFGHPDYYPRFGFQRASAFHITTAHGESYDALMAMPLYNGALDGIAGRYHEDPVFQIDAAEKAAFDRGFPPKALRAPVSADALLARLATPARQALQEQHIQSLCDLRRYSEREVGSWQGIDRVALGVMKATMRENGYAWGERTAQGCSGC